MKNKQYVIALELICMVAGGTAYSAVNPASQGYVDIRIKKLQSQIDAITIGQKGSTGATGPAGTPGPQGNTGSTGPAGVQGIQGGTGTTGPAGAQGFQGAAGVTGATGTHGTQGNTGTTGPAGAQGIQGNTGVTGVQGVQGNTGAAGAQGIQGNTGAAGIQGIQGNTGATGVQGTQGNTGATGVQGIQGNTGATGVQGIQGNTGATGVQGIQGDAGVTGIQGIQGNTGVTGVQGIQGDAGVTGAQGTQGDTGVTGIQGIQGNIGTTGSAGAQGFQGNTGPTGAIGSGVAVGGTTGQILVKKSDNDYDTEWINLPGTYTVGQQAMGGIVFYVDSTRQHGLIAASMDNSDGARWRNNNTMLIGTTTSDGIFGGRNSTTRIMANQNADGSHEFAAKICTYYRIQTDGTTACNNPGLEGDTCYADWYLPSKFELNQLYLKKELFSGPGAFNPTYYWSTTESGPNTSSYAFYQDFSDGSQNGALKNSSYRVRCIRAF